MDELTRAVKYNDRWFLEPSPRTNIQYKDMMERSDLVPIEEHHSSGKIVYYVSKETALFVLGKWKKKIDLILDEFGETEWLDRLRSELGLAKEEGLRGINAFMANPSTVGKYKELRDGLALMAKDRIETRHI